MNTVTIDSVTYKEMEMFAHINNVDIADVVKKSFHFFVEKLKLTKTQAKTTQYELPSHLKKMRGILSGVEDSNDERLNYILSK